MANEKWLKNNTPHIFKCLEIMKLSSAIIPARTQAFSISLLYHTWHTSSYPQIRLLMASSWLLQIIISPQAGNESLFTSLHPRGKPIPASRQQISPGVSFTRVVSRAQAWHNHWPKNKITTLFRLIKVYPIKLERDHPPWADRRVNTLTLGDIEGTK